MQKLEKLRAYFVLNQEEEEEEEEDGNVNIVDKLKAGQSAYHQKFLNVVKEFDYKTDNAAILSWHYKYFLGLDEELAEDSKRNKSCRYCGCRSNSCSCNVNLRYYWEAAQLVSLMMPSSCAAERVFSLLNNLFNQKQTRTLGDQIFLALYLNCNKRDS